MIVHRAGAPREVARLAARRFVDLAADTIRARGVFRVALSGGSTPLGLYRELTKAALDWTRVEFYWSDERFVPAGHPDSNEGAARRALLDAVDAPRVFPMATEATADASAARYAALLPDQLDLVLLGVGADGHTASLFPGSRGLDAQAPRALAVRAPTTGSQRITLGASYICGARAVWFLVTGEDKAVALARLLLQETDRDGSTPAVAVARDARHVELFADDAAMGSQR